MNEAAYAKRKHRVFIADDHPIVREGLALLINREEDLAVCGEAGDVSSALQAIKKSKPDMLIVDLALAQSSGVRLIEDVLYSYGEVPILVLSMYDESVYAERCLKAGAKGYIMKEESPEKTLSAIRMVLNGGIYVSDNLGKEFLHKFVTGKFSNAESPVKVLTNRELEIYQLFGRGMKKSEIADQLHLSVKTIDNNIKHIMKKMNLRSSREIIVHAVRFNKNYI